MPFHRFKDEDGVEHGSFEVFCPTKGDLKDMGLDPRDEGWYWWACFPGCLPDSDPHGPFNTEREAIEDAQKGG